MSKVDSFSTHTRPTMFWRLFLFTCLFVSAATSIYDSAKGQSTPLKQRPASDQDKAELADKHFSAGKSMHRKGDYDCAIVDFNKAILLNPKNPNFYIWRSSSLLTRSDIHGAIAGYTKAIELDPKNKIAFKYRGICRDRQGNYDLAIADFTKALELTPEASSLYNLRGNSWHRKRQYKRAIVDYTSAIDLSPRSPVFFSNRGKSWSRMGYTNNAARDKAIAKLLSTSGKEKIIPEEELTKRVENILQQAISLELIFVTPEWSPESSLTCYGVINQFDPDTRKTVESIWKSKISRTETWSNLSAILLSTEVQCTNVRDWGPLAKAPRFANSRGATMTVRKLKTERFSVGKGHSLTVTKAVQKHLRIRSRSNYKASRYVVIVEEAHSDLGQQLAVLKGLESLYDENPWLKAKGNSVFLTEAWPAEKTLSVKPLIRAFPKPNERQVYNGLASWLIPGYIAFEWKHDFGVPLIGHEDPELYRTSNYLHWIEHGKNLGKENIKLASKFQGLFVQARNESSGKTLVKSLDDYSCPFLFIGYGHIGPHGNEDSRWNAKPTYAQHFSDNYWLELAEFVGKSKVKRVKNASGRSVVSRLREKGIGYVRLEPISSISVRNPIGHSKEYINLRGAQHFGKVKNFVSNLAQSRNQFALRSKSCTVIPDPEAAANFLLKLGDKSLLPLPKPDSKSNVYLARVLNRCKSGIGCFPAGTLVASQNGPVKIEEIAAGDLVWAYSVENDVWELKPVQLCLKRRYHGILVEFTVGTESIQATSEHPIWVIQGVELTHRPIVQDISSPVLAKNSSGRWVRAIDLRKGDQLFLRDGQSVSVESVTSQIMALDVYNLDVADFSTFSVGRPRILVHNDDSCSKNAPKSIFPLPKTWRSAKGVEGKFSDGKHTFRIDTHNLSRGERFHVHVFNPKGKEIAVIQGRGSNGVWRQSHSGQTLMKPSEVNQRLRNDIRRLMRNALKNIN